MAIGTIALTTCDTQSVDPIIEEVERIELSPQAITVQPDEPVDFPAAAFTTSGDIADVSITWSATGGAITEMGVQDGRHHSRYSHGECGTFEVTVTAPGGMSRRASVEITCPVASVTVSPANGTPEIGSTLPLQATQGSGFSVQRSGFSAWARPSRPSDRLTV